MQKSVDCNDIGNFSLASLSERIPAPLSKQDPGHRMYQ